MSTTFGDRLEEAVTAYCPLCVGIDPHRGLVESWGLPYDLSGLERFTMTCVEAFGGAAAAVKPQSAFFEVFGAKLPDRASSPSAKAPSPWDAGAPCPMDGGWLSARRSGASSRCWD